MDFKPYKIGKYLLLERIASGGMAEVYRAKASGAGGFEKELAVKRILPSYSSNDEFRRMFEYEARLSNKLTHANIVQIYDFVKPGDSYLLAMEFVDGKNLRQLVNKIKKSNFILPIEASVYIINEVCKGLEYAHSKKDNITGKHLNIIHRDMSPQNIMISYEGAIKIVDFGIAKAKDRVDETRSGVIKGKFGYMSPEQANGQTMDLRSDIFSTGIILWELVTGKRLFATDNDLATLKLIQECKIPHPSKTNPKVTSDLENILLKALTKDMPLRFQTAGAFQKALQEYLNRHHSTYSADDLAVSMRSVFKSEIEGEKKRYEEANRQSIPYSQGVAERDADESDGDSRNEQEDEITQSEVEIDTVVTLGEEVELPKGSEVSDSSTIAKTSALPAPQNEKTMVQDELSLPELVEQSARTEKSGSIKIEDTDVEKMPVLDQKTAITGSAEDLFEENEETTGEVPLTGSPVSRPRGLTPTPTNKTQGTHTPSVREPQLTSSKSDVFREPDREKSLELENVPKPAVRREPPPSYRGHHHHARRRSSVLPFLLIFMALGLTFYLYRLLFSREFVPTVVEIIKDRTVTKEEKIPLPPAAPVNGVPAGECLIKVDSYPSGAEVTINKVKKGLTSLSTLVPCKKDVNLELRLDKHETISENIFIRDSEVRVSKSLKRIPLGGVEVFLSQNAEVFLDGKFVGNATANQGMYIELRAGKRYQLKFRNQTYQLEKTEEVTVQEGFRQRLTVTLGDAAERKPSMKRRR